MVHLKRKLRIVPADHFRVDCSRMNAARTKFLKKAKCILLGSPKLAHQIQAAYRKQFQKLITFKNHQI